MVCNRCQKSLRGSEGIRCGKCDSRYHFQCVNTFPELDSGDKPLHWVCATCQNPASGVKLVGPDLQALFKAINAISEKFELVNKIQLPKLNNDLLLLKTMTDRIAKQNEEILLKIEALKSKKRGDHLKSPSNHYRWRNLESPRKEEREPILGAEKFVRYRTRRRSYPIFKLLLQLNRRLRRRRKSRR